MQVHDVRNEKERTTDITQCNLFFVSQKWILNINYEIQLENSETSD